LPSKKNEKKKPQAKLKDPNVGKWYSLSIGQINQESAIVVATDITEMKMLSEELHQAMHAKGRFLANMSHEVGKRVKGAEAME
jgi:hypothetical protein